VTSARRPGWGALLGAATFAVSFVFSSSAEVGRMGLPAALGISAVAAGAVWLSARRPVAALVVVSALAAALPVVASTFPVMDLVVVVVAFQAVLHADLPPWAVASVCFVLLTVVDAWQRAAGGRGFMEPTVLYPLVLTGLVVGLGLQSRRVRRQHEQLLALRDGDRRRAVSDERRRIARDLHDVAAHHLSALVVRNKLATRLGTFEALTDAARFTARTAADTLDGLRGVVQVLTGDDAAPLAPTPQPLDLHRMLGTMREAGLQVACRIPPARGDDTPVGGDVPVDVAVAAVRIAGEALANVLHHRGPGRAWLEVERDPHTLTLLVEDDGPGTWRPEAADPAWHVPGHHGLVGMRERAESCGGHLRIGPSPRGGWRVSAVLPVP
jgi:signal transduction histidine kinase